MVTKPIPRMPVPTTAGTPNGGSSLRPPEPFESVRVSLVGTDGIVVENELGGAVIEMGGIKVTVVGGATVVVLSVRVVLVAWV